MERCIEFLYKHEMQNTLIVEMHVCRHYTLKKSRWNMRAFFHASNSPIQNIIQEKNLNEKAKPCMTKPINSKLTMNPKCL